jgi:predicted metal-dependent enzyme (double-stranded beta helix superfamily)
MEILLAQLSGALSAELTPLAAAQAASRCLHAANLSPEALSPEQRIGSETGYISRVIHAQREPLFSISRLVWLPGQRTTIHDHLCWGAVCVLQGVEEETTYRLSKDDSGDYLQQRRTITYTPGSITAFAPPEDVHQVHNAGDDVTISIHVYGADLTGDLSSIQNVYTPDLIR